MAKTTRGGGSGQGRVRQYRSGRMIKCNDKGCQRSMRYINLSDDKSEIPTWKCGLDPLLAKTSRIGQQKQSRR